MILKKEPTLTTAIDSLCVEVYPGKGTFLTGNPEEFTDLSGLVIGSGVGSPSFSLNDVKTRYSELQTQWTNEEYARSREAEYPSIQECVHAILDDDLTALQEKRQAVKTKYPKG